MPQLLSSGPPLPINPGKADVPPLQSQASVTAGSIFDKTRTELRVWFAAIWYVTNQKQGVSALGLQRVLGLGSYETAWTMLHRLRRAMVRPGRDLLHGEVEVDESYLALTDRKHPISAKGRQSNTTKAMVAIAVEVVPDGFGRIRIQRLDRGNQQNLQSFITETVAPGSKVHSDGSGAYYKIEDLGFDHNVTVHLGSDIPAHQSMPGVHRVAALLQRWMMGPITAPCSPANWTITSTNSCSDSTVEHPAPGDCCFTGYFSRLSRLHRSLTATSLPVVASC